MGTEIVRRQGQSAEEGEPGPDNPEDKTKTPLGIVASPQHLGIPLSFPRTFRARTFIRASRSLKSVRGGTWLVSLPSRSHSAWWVWVEARVAFGCSSSAGALTTPPRATSIPRNEPGQ